MFRVARHAVSRSGGEILQLFYFLLSCVMNSDLTYHWSWTSARRALICRLVEKKNTQSLRVVILLKIGLRKSLSFSIVRGLRCMSAQEATWEDYQSIISDCCDDRPVCHWRLTGFYIRTFPHPRQTFLGQSPTYSTPWISQFAVCFK